MSQARNVLGGELRCHSLTPLTGFFRDGYCRTDDDDYGKHVVAAVVTEEFLQFTKSRGNDLITPRPEWNFPGLKAGDRWCLCASRWLEAYEAGVAPPLVLDACPEEILSIIPLDVLLQHGIRSP